MEIGHSDSDEDLFGDTNNVVTEVPDNQLGTEVAMAAYEARMDVEGYMSELSADSDPSVIYETDSVEELVEDGSSVPAVVEASAQVVSGTPKAVPRMSCLARMASSRIPESDGRQIPGSGALTESGNVAPATPAVSSVATVGSRPVRGRMNEFRSSDNERMVATYQAPLRKSGSRAPGVAAVATGSAVRKAERPPYATIPLSATRHPWQRSCLRFSPLGEARQ